MFLRRRRIVAVGFATALLTGVLVTGGPDVSHAKTAPGSMASAITGAPIKPPDCTATQIAAVNLDHCALMVDGTPSDHGFPVPPYPVPDIVTTPTTADVWAPLGVGAEGAIVTLLQRALQPTSPKLLVDGAFGASTAAAVKLVQTQSSLPVTGMVDAVLAEQLGILVTATLGPWPPTGWVWDGNSYSKSPVLADWEKRLVKGTVQADPDVAPLFEGFLAQVKAGGYRVEELGAYAFRCVATSVRNCSGQSPDELSYHAWGAAMDMNWTQNPLQTVTSPTDACGTAAEHNQPDWVLALASHWGLYWGGWYSCPRAGARSVIKDVHHFEYRGTPELAHQILAKNTAANAPQPPVPGLGDLLLSCGDRGGVVAQLRDALPAGDRPAESSSLTQTFTATLATALTNVQKRIGLPMTGALDPATASALGITVHHTEVFPVLHVNSCGAAVKSLQTALGVNPSGSFTYATMASLRTWQRAHDLAPTGVTDTATAAVLGLALEKPAGPPPDTSSTSSSSTSSTSTSSTTSTTSTTVFEPPTTLEPDAVLVAVPLALGARGASVSELQTALTDAGYPTPVTGSFGTATNRNLRKFKVDHHLPVTSTLTIAAAQLLGLTPMPKVPTKPGARGENVLLLQQALLAEGFTIAADGRFGPGTKAALKTHQQRAGLKVTGVLDAPTAKSFGW